jgi:uncharacterized protein YggE
MNEQPRNVFLYILSGFVVVLTAVGIAGFAALLGIANPQRYDNTITVQGTGEVMAAPDVADFTFTMYAENKDVTVAQTEVATKVAKLTETLLASGIPEKDIQTQSFTSNPKYEWQTKSVACPVGSYCPQDGKQILVGYEVSQTDIVTVRDLNLSSAVLAAIGKADVQNMWGPNLRVDDMDGVRKMAREEAVNKAKDQAKVLSEQLGVRLTKLTSFSEDGGYGGPMPMYAESSRDMAYGGDAMVKAVPAPEISTGENKITTTVYLTYKIK